MNSILNTMIELTNYDECGKYKIKHESFSDNITRAELLERGKKISQQEDEIQKEYNKISKEILQIFTQHTLTIQEISYIMEITMSSIICSHPVFQDNKM